MDESRIIELTFRTCDCRQAATRVRILASCEPCSVPSRVEVRPWQVGWEPPLCCPTLSWAQAPPGGQAYGSGSGGKVRTAMMVTNSAACPPACSRTTTG